MGRCMPGLGLDSRCYILWLGKGARLGHTLPSSEQSQDGLDPCPEKAGIPVTFPEGAGKF